MADISTEINDIQSAVYGEEVRSSIISAIEKINDVADTAEEAAETAQDSAAASATEAAASATEAASSASSAGSYASSAAASATEAAESMSSAESEFTVEEQEVTLSNSLVYPFNNSETTVSLATTRSTTNYMVEAEASDYDGNVGAIEISDKLANGFNIAFTGSASSVTVALKIRGGYY